jgi:hypothetical protein
MCNSPSYFHIPNATSTRDSRPSSLLPEYKLPSWKSPYADLLGEPVRNASGFEIGRLQNQVFCSKVVKGGVVENEKEIREQTTRELIGFLRRST